MDRDEIKRALAEYFELYLDESEIEELSEAERKNCKLDDNSDKYLNLDMKSYDWTSGCSFGAGEREHNWLCLAEIVKALEE